MIITNDNRVSIVVLLAVTGWFLFKYFTEKAAPKTVKTVDAKEFLPKDKKKN